MKTTQELKAQILSRVAIGNNWGKACNTIQDVACQYLKVKDWNKAARKMSSDAQACEGSDFLQMNGHFWDWKEFNRAASEIVSVFLDYFTDTDLEIIAQHI